MNITRKRGIIEKLSSVTRGDTPQGTGPSHIFITGLPGSGKTTLAKKKAKELGIPLISLDRLAAENKRYPGTSEARRYIRELDTPHVIEGTQLLGFRKEDFKGHRVLLLEESRGVIVDRLVRRGWNDSRGKLHKGEGERGRAVEFHDSLVEAVEDFKRKEIGSKTNWDKIKERDTSAQERYVGHIAGPSGSGKSTLMRRLKEKHPQLVVQDLDELVQDRGGSAAEFLRKNEKSPILFAGMVGDVQAGDIPKSSRYLLDVGPLTSAWRGYKRKPGTARPWLPTPSPEQAEAIRKRRSLSTLHKHSRKARAQIREAKQKGYVPRTAKEIENELSEKLHRGEASEFRKAPGVEVVKGTGVIAHIAGPSGSGKTTILERIKEKHPNIVTKDLDDLDDVAKAELGITGRKRNWSDEKLTKFYAKKQEVLDRFLAENEGKDIVLAGHHMAAGPPELAEAWSLKVPGRKILLNTGARKSALRRSQRGDHPGTDNRPKYRVEAKKDIKELTSRGYKKKSSRQIMRMVKVSKHTRRLAGGKTVAVKAHTRGSSRGTLTEKLGARVTDDKKKRRRKAAAIAGGTLAGGVGMLVARKGGRADLLYNLKNPLKGRWGPRLLGTKSKDPDLDKPVPSDVVRQATEVVKRLRKSGVDLNHARIALTGLPGSGKSTLAKEITRQLRARHGVHGQPKPALKRSSFFPEEGIGQSKGRTILSKSWDLDKIPHYMYDAGDAAKKKRFLRKAPSFKVFEQSSLLATGGGRGYDALIHVDPPKAVRDARILKRGRGALQLEWVNMKKIDDKTKEVFSNTPGKTLPSVGPIRLKVTRKAPTPDFTPLSSKERINRGEAKKYVAAAAAGGVGGGIIEGLVSNREKKASLQLAPSKLIVSRST